MRRFLPLVAALTAGCATSPTLPEPDGEPLGDGMYSFDTQRAAVRGESELAPWSPGFFYPELQEPAGAVDGQRTLPKRRSHPTDAGPMQSAAWLWYRGYKNTLSRVDGSTCRFYPSCSTFGLNAVRDHGLLGVAMAFGRLHKNHQAEEQYPSTQPPYLDDPVSNYTFWLRTPRLDDFGRYDNPAHGWSQHLRVVDGLDY